ncbi:hypothetical protein BN1708_016252, partial [Verticillium longisporum]
MQNTPDATMPEENNRTLSLVRKKRNSKHDVPCSLNCLLYPRGKPKRAPKTLFGRLLALLGVDLQTRPSSGAGERIALKLHTLVFWLRLVRDVRSANSEQLCDEDFFDLFLEALDPIPPYQRHKRTFTVSAYEGLDVGSDFFGFRQKSEVQEPTRRALRYRGKVRLPDAEPRGIKFEIVDGSPVCHAQGSAVTYWPTQLLTDLKRYDSTERRWSWRKVY